MFCSFFFWIVAFPYGFLYNLNNNLPLVLCCKHVLTICNFSLSSKCLFRNKTPYIKIVKYVNLTDIFPICILGILPDSKSDTHLCFLLKFPSLAFDVLRLHGYCVPHGQTPHFSQGPVTH